MAYFRNLLFTISVAKSSSPTFELFRAVARSASVTPGDVASSSCFSHLLIPMFSTTTSSRHFSLMLCIASLFMPIAINISLDLWAARLSMVMIQDISFKDSFISICVCMLPWQQIKPNCESMYTLCISSSIYSMDNLHMNTIEELTFRCWLCRFSFFKGALCSGRIS